MNLPSVGKMVRVEHPTYKYDIWVEIIQHRLSGDEHIVDCDWYREHVEPMRIEIPKGHMERTISAIEIARVTTTRRRYREITFEDRDKYADKKKFLNYQ